MKNIFEQLQTAFIYREKGNDLLHFDESVIVDAVELEDKKKSIKKITDFIYGLYYSKQHLPKTTLFEEVTLETDDAFILALAKIFPERRQESKYWTVTGIVNSDIYKVCKNGITLTIDRNIHLPLTEREKEISVNDTVTILFSCHFPNISYGFYVYKSDIGEIDTLNGIGRVYFNLLFEHAVNFTQGLLDILYKNKMKFDYKILKNLRTHYRVDNAVLYFSLSDFKEIKKLIFPYIVSNTQMFNDEVSVFHYRLSNGVGFAEEPTIKEENESYGLNRCKIIAETVYHSLEILESTGAIPRQNFIERFKQNGIDWERIYLNPNSSLQKELIY